MNLLLGVFWFLLSGISLWLFQKSRQNYLKWTSLGFFLVLAVAMFNHWLPGIQNILVYDKIKLSPDSVPFTMYFNFDKTWIGLLIWVMVLSREPKTIRSSDFPYVFKTLGALLLVMVPIVLISGYAHWDPKFPPQTLLWATNNLLLVCMAEECFFRGFIQGGLASWKPQWKWQALALAAIAFGLQHYKGGIGLILLATLAGVFYGYVYLKTRRIEAPILVHFGFNLIHFLFFSYPALGK